MGSVEACDYVVKPLVDNGQKNHKWTTACFRFGMGITIMNFTSLLLKMKVPGGEQLCHRSRAHLYAKTMEVHHEYLKEKEKTARLNEVLLTPTSSAQTSTNVRSRCTLKGCNNRHSGKCIHCDDELCGPHLIKLCFKHYTAYKNCWFNKNY